MIMALGIFSFVILFLKGTVPWFPKTKSVISAKKYNLPTLSTGEVFRREIKNQTELGKLVDSLISKGQLVPDKITNKIVLDELALPKYQNGFILDGYPRNINQIDVLEEESYQIKKKLVTDLQKIISPVKILKLKQAEDNFNKSLLKQYRKRN